MLARPVSNHVTSDRQTTTKDDVTTRPLRQLEYGSIVGKRKALTVNTKISVQAGTPCKRYKITNNMRWNAMVGGRLEPVDLIFVQDVLIDTTIPTHGSK